MAKNIKKCCASCVHWKYDILARRIGGGRCEVYKFVCLADDTCNKFEVIKAPDRWEREEAD